MKTILYWMIRQSWNHKQNPNPESIQYIVYQLRRNWTKWAIHSYLRTFLPEITYRIPISQNSRRTRCWTLQIPYVAYRRKLTSGSYYSFYLFIMYVDFASTFKNYLISILDFIIPVRPHQCKTAIFSQIFFDRYFGKKKIYREIASRAKFSHFSHFTNINYPFHSCSTITCETLRRELK